MKRKRILKAKYKKQIRLHEERVVKMAFDILDEVHERFFEKSKLLKKHQFHKNRSCTYFKAMLKVVNYLEKLSKNYYNPIEFLLQDYFTVNYHYYKRIKRIPSITHLSAGGAGTNCQRFEEWIDQYELDHKEEYWIREKVNLGKIKTEVKKELKRKRVVKGTNEHVPNINIEII